MAEASSPHSHQGGRGQGPNSPFEGMPSDLKGIKSLVRGPEGTLQI